MTPAPWHDVKPSAADEGIPCAPLRPLPFRSARPWAGERLGGPDQSVGELWLAGPTLEVDVPDLGRLTLDALCAALGEPFVGRRAFALLGARFPLLAKIIDAADWLSLQVHPSDSVARELGGPGALGKTEAWLVLDAAPGSSLVVGPAAGVTEQQLLEAVATGSLGRDLCDVRPAMAGDAMLVRAGTIHAIGPGTLMYELEQPSDLTFRISDWDRSPSLDRPLHLAQALRAVRPDRRAVSIGHGWRIDAGVLEVREFRLELVAPSLRHRVVRRPAGESLEVVTAVRGRARVTGEGWSEGLAPYETLVVPAGVTEYGVERDGDAEETLVCVGDVP